MSLDSHIIKLNQSNADLIESMDKRLSFLLSEISVLLSDTAILNQNALDLETKIDQLTLALEPIINDVSALKVIQEEIETKSKAQQASILYIKSHAHFYDYIVRSNEELKEAEKQITNKRLGRKIKPSIYIDKCTFPLILSCPLAEYYLSNKIHFKIPDKNTQPIEINGDYITINEGCFYSDCKFIESGFHIRNLNKYITLKDQLFSGNIIIGSTYAININEMGGFYPHHPSDW